MEQKYCTSCKGEAHMDFAFLDSNVRKESVNTPKPIGILANP